MVKNSFSFELEYQPPYATSHMLSFLSSRLLTGSEFISPTGNYSRTISVFNSHTNSQEDGWLVIDFSSRANSVLVTMADNLLPCFDLLQERIKLFLDLKRCPLSIARGLESNLPKPIPRIPGLRIPGCIDFFEVGVRAILGQQVTLKTARSLSHKFLQVYGKKLTTPQTALYLRFPVPAEVVTLSVAQIASIGIFRQRAKAIIAYAKFCSENSDIIALSCQPLRTLAALLELPGIGKWTANYIVMRGLSWQNASLETDAVVKNVLARTCNRSMKTCEIKALHQRWQPWSSYVCLHLWHWANHH